MLPDDVASVLQPFLEGPVRRHAAVGGGCIAHACRIETDVRSYFLKWSRDAAAASFLAERDGLDTLRSADSPLVVPHVLAARAASEDAPGFLLMDWLEEGRRTSAFWEDFGRGLAALHRHTEARYGFASDNFIGRLPQLNEWEADWPTFFRRQRLAPQVARARAEGRWQKAWDAWLEALYHRLEDLLPARPPASVVHGDLWSGNFLATRTGTAALIDPAAYYGHRETDLALTELFGGYDARFYAAYREAWPLESAYASRRDVYNLYHLLNHLNHFGDGYARSVESVLAKFG